VTRPDRSELRFDGRALAAARIRAGFRSREALAEAVNLAYTTITAYETDYRQPSWASALRIASILGVDINSLLTADPPPPRRTRGRP